jgi:outer membrane receptor for ferrienterochelin and colicins
MMESDSPRFHRWVTSGWRITTTVSTVSIFRPWREGLVHSIGKTTLLLLCLLLPFIGIAQHSITGTVAGNDGAIGFANIIIKNTKMGAAANADGQFELRDVPQGEFVVQVSAIGYRRLEVPVTVNQADIPLGEIRMTEDALGLDEAVVTGSRYEMTVTDAPIIVSRINARMFEATQTVSISEGLSFSPGLRLENNCSNCGFTQLRMNGMEGPYSQVLINSRAIFSALTGVYGLDMFPANMVDRIEVVRGAGSVLYGGNAIAGTVNIITKVPTENSFDVGMNYAFSDMEAPDRTITLNGSIVSDDLRRGISLYGFNRDRQAWDANGDAISEITSLRNTTFGFDAFMKPGKRNMLRLNAFHIHEFRRGGVMDFDLQPHEVELTEQLRHRILGGSLSFEQYTEDLRHRFSAYMSAQGTVRDSYYGAGGRVLAPGDSLTEDDLLALNAYGRSTDLTMVGGLQYSFQPNEKWLLLAGSEYQLSNVDDAMPGYGRTIMQEVGTWGSYLQAEWRPSKRWSITAGGRFDLVNINGSYAQADEQQTQQRVLPVAVPRLNVMYEPAAGLRLRAGFAQGYRAPQAFDEDLHIEVVGGAATFVRLGDDLRTERSNSVTASLNWERQYGKTQLNIIVEGFYTHLSDPFITADRTELPSGVAVLTKRNGSGATVAGANMQVNMAFSRKLTLQLGATVQMARYTEDEEIWAPEDVSELNADSVISTRQMLRTPMAYGFLLLGYSPLRDLDLSLSGVYTGRMDVPHMIGEEDQGGYTIIKRTPQFMELNFRASYAIQMKGRFRVQVFAGMQNIFDSFQRDFDLGPDRDPGYVYGPTRPRTVFVGVKVGMP